MISILSTNITSPLGFTTQENWNAVRSGTCALKQEDGWRGLPGTISAGLFTPEQTAALMVEGCSRFTSLAIRSIGEALQHTDMDVRSPRTLLVLSTTKGDIETLEQPGGTYLAPGEAARRIADHFGFTSTPVVVCNACISGATAQILAGRLIQAGDYDSAVVCGVDCLSEFTVAGFMSFKALSPERCRPFDIERLGLNLGEAAATVILGRSAEADGTQGCTRPADGGTPAALWKIASGFLDNDAYHLSAPSPAGEGVYRAIMGAMDGRSAEDLALVGVHGTATMFNDQMESKAIEHAGLSGTPVSALKGYYGHTLGAAGVLEAVITMCALDEGIILPSMGFSEIGVSGRISISGSRRTTGRTTFLKILSGFGGCNAAMVYTKECVPMAAEPARGPLRTLHSVRITPSSLEIDGERIPTENSGRELLTEIYKSRIGDWPKFYKMDLFTRLVFAAAELLAQKAGFPQDGTQRGIVLFNASSSIMSDRQHIATFTDKDNFYPSPSVFLYTLPNIVTGEIAIRQGCKGESTLLILERRDEALMERIAQAAFFQSGLETLITGWADCSGEDCFEADLRIVTI